MYHRQNGSIRFKCKVDDAGLPFLQTAIPAPGSLRRQPKDVSSLNPLDRLIDRFSIRLTPADWNPPEGGQKPSHP
jgi:hypothetical protein